MNIKQGIFRSFSLRLSLVVAFFTALMMVLIQLLQGWSAYRQVKSDATTESSMALRINTLEMNKSMILAEEISSDMKYLAKLHIHQPDSMATVSQVILNYSLAIKNCAIAFVPGYFKGKYEKYMPGAKRVDGKVENLCFYTEEHYDYPTKTWFLTALKTGEAVWTQPYHDMDSVGNILASYVFPIAIDNEKPFAVGIVDVVLNWFNHGDEKGAIPQLVVIGNGERSCDLSHKNVSGKNKHLKLDDNKCAKPITPGFPDNHYQELMVHIDELQEKEGHFTLKFNDKNYYTSFTHMPNTDWNIAVVSQYDDIFASLLSLRTLMLILLVLGVAGVVLPCIWIIKRNSRPLETYSLLAQQISEGDFDVALPKLKYHDEIWQVGQSLQYMSTSLKQYMGELKAATAKETAIKSQMHIAKDIQMRMLPKSFDRQTAGTTIDVNGWLEAMQEVGGDLYDFQLSKDRKKLFISIGDVSGKGVPASLYMAVTQSLARAFAFQQMGSSDIIRQLNEIVSRDNDMNMFVTMFIGWLDLETGLLTYCSAGHNPPVLVRNGSQVEQIEVKRQFPIGLMEGASYSTSTLQLNDGDVLLLYTDGVTEAENSKQEQYGEERLMQVLSQIGEREASAIIELVREDVNKFRDGATPNDDTTIVPLRYHSSHAQPLVKTLTIKNEMNELDRFISWIEEELEAMATPIEVITKMKIALEEAVVNVINYSQMPAGSDIVFSLETKDTKDGHQLVFTIKDTGVEFDPTQHNKAILDGDPTERPIGGLGIHMMHEIMDVIEYLRENHHNILTLKKNY